MLPRGVRLRRSAEVTHVVRRGRRLYTPYVTIHQVARPEMNHHRVACVVGKRVAKSSVQRHRYQRWLRHVAGEWLRQHPGPPTYDMVWVARPAIKAVKSLRELQESVVKIKA